MTTAARIYWIIGAALGGVGFYLALRALLKIRDRESPTADVLAPLEVRP